MCPASPPHSPPPHPNSPAPTRLDSAPDRRPPFRVCSGSMGARSVSGLEQRKRPSITALPPPIASAATVITFCSSTRVPTTVTAGTATASATLAQDTAAAPTLATASPKTLSAISQKLTVPVRSLSPAHDLDRPVTRSVRASPSPAFIGGVGNSAFGGGCADLVVTLPTYPFPPPRMPLVTPLVAKNPPRKSLLKRWRAKSTGCTSSSASRALAHLQLLEQDLQREEVNEIVACARVARAPGDDDIPQIRRLVESAKAASREDIVRVATRLAGGDARPSENDSVTLALHELEAQARAEVQVILDRDRGAIRIEASERLQFVREQIVAAKASELVDRRLSRPS